MFSFHTRMRTPGRYDNGDASLIESTTRLHRFSDRAADCHMHAIGP